ncbi:undecaprenyl-diphosphatase [Caproicibacter sp.]|uniref:undecaprenyl-diphosphatase n=1 Tax=Caproicibacter sp. TaxID=2814884 RepID=UPI003988B561
MNYKVFLLINGLANRNPLLDHIMLFSSEYLPYLMAFCVLILYLSGIINQNRKYRETAFQTVLLTAVNLIINLIIGTIIYVPRPFTEHQVHLLYPHAPDSSFPSDHATASMSIAIGLKYGNRVLGLLMIVLSFLVGFSRIYVGHHYPLDVAASYLIAAGSGFLYHKFLLKKTSEIYFKAEAWVVKKYSKAGGI